MTDRRRGPSAPALVLFVLIWAAAGTASAQSNAIRGENAKPGYEEGRSRGAAGRLEYHGPPLGTHPGLVVLSEGPVYAANGEKRTGSYATTIYAARKGNLVFNAGTCWWNVVLSTPPGFQNPPRKDFRRNDARIQRITRNVLDRMIATKLSD